MANFLPETDLALPAAGVSQHFWVISIHAESSTKFDPISCTPSLVPYNTWLRTGFAQIAHCLHGRLVFFSWLRKSANLRVLHVSTPARIAELRMQVRQAEEEEKAAQKEKQRIDSIPRKTKGGGKGDI